MSSSNTCEAAITKALDYSLRRRVALTHYLHDPGNRPEGLNVIEGRLASAALTALVSLLATHKDDN
jgi:hypothetical protein